LEVFAKGTRGSSGIRLERAASRTLDDQRAASRTLGDGG